MGEPTEGNCEYRGGTIHRSRETIMNMLVHSRRKGHVSFSWLGSPDEHNTFPLRLTYLHASPRASVEALSLSLSLARPP